MPTRQDTRRNPTTRSNPYARNNDSGLSSTQHVASVAETSSHFLPSLNVPNNPGFPTYEQYKHLENAYLDSLHPRKRDKALINQAMFDRIWDTFMAPGSRNESPQFRFWVRKMFTMTEPPTSVSSSGEPAVAIPPVVLHDGRPVAIREQIYDIICSCHARAEHGGRDKTRAIVREHYSWVPKELVSQFVKACPTCTLKKCGNTELAAIMEQQVMNTSCMPNQAQQGQALWLRQLCEPDVKFTSRKQDDQNEQPVVSWPLSGGPLDSTQSSFFDSSTSSSSSVSTASSGPPTPFLRLESVPGSQLPEPPLMSREPQSHPMSREVSLYHGLPNGWQYHSKYPEALEVHVKGKGRKNDVITPAETRRAKRPRIPSMLPLNKFDHKSTCGEDKENEQDIGYDKQVTLPSLEEALSDGGATDRTSVTMTPISGFPQKSLPQSLQRFQIFLPVPTPAGGNLHALYVPQIDPVLLQEGNNNVIGSQQLEPSSQASPLFNSDIGNENLDNVGKTNKSLVSTKNSGSFKLPSLDAGKSTPLRSFQSLQHLLDWKSGAAHDDSPSTPSSVLASSASSARFSVLPTVSASREEIPFPIYSSANGQVSSSSMTFAPHMPTSKDDNANIKN